MRSAENKCKRFFIQLKVLDIKDNQVCYKKVLKKLKEKDYKKVNSYNNNKV